MNGDDGQFNLSHVNDDLFVASISGNTVAKQPKQLLQHKIVILPSVLKKRTCCSTIALIKNGLDTRTINLFIMLL